MVSSSHEALHRIFQEDPGLFARAVKGLGVLFDTPVSVSKLPTDLTENRPVERRVDTLLRMDTADNGSFVLAVESQGRRDPDKPASWAYYLSHLYAKYRTPRSSSSSARTGAPRPGRRGRWTSARRSGPL
jgi:hypothetical protein